MKRVARAVCALVLAGIAVAPATGQEAAEAVKGPDAQRLPEWPAGSRGGMRFFIDAASFRGPEGFTLQEFYFLLDGRQLQFVPEGGQFVAQVDLSVRITGGEGEEVAAETWTRHLSVQSLSDIPISHD